MKLHSDPGTDPVRDRRESALPPWVCSAYVLAIFALGSIVIAESLRTVIASGEYSWLALGLLTVIGGSFALKVPGVPATVSLSEVFVFAMILSFGYAPATLAVAADGLIMSLRRGNRRLHRVLFNISEPALSVWVASALFAYVSGQPPLAEAPTPLTRLVVPVLTMSAVYFLLNSWLTALAVSTETGGSPYRIWRTHFAWLSLNYFGGASIALFLALNANEITLGSLAAVLPLLILLYFTFRSSIRGIENANQHLADLNKLHVATVESLAMAVDARDQVTHGHIRRVQSYALTLAERLGITNPSDLKAIEVAALLHDTGKIAVPDHILNKPGKLTPAEYERMKRHAVIGADILSAVDFPYPVVPIVRHHHENWDGTGYPDGLKGTKIPIGARILSVIDCYDALMSDRPYRRALPTKAALAIIQQRRETLYDPDVVDAFLEIVPRLPEVNREPMPPLSNVPITRTAPVADGCTAMSERAWGVPSYDELLRLGELSAVMSGHASLEDATDLIARHMRRITPASLVVFYLADPALDILSLVYASGQGEEAVRDIHPRLGYGLSGWVAATRSMMVNADPSLDLGSRIDWIAPRLESAMCAPLVSDGTLVGVVSLYAAGVDAFTPAQARSLSLMSAPLATALASARRFDVDRTGAFIDTATGLPNERYLDALLAGDGWFERSWPGPRTVVAIRLPSIVVRFEADLLTDSVTAVREAVRGADLIFRRGQDELIVLVAEGDADAARRICERLIASFAEIRVLSGRPPSVGLACAPADGHRWDDLVATACERREVRAEGGLRVLAYATA